ncbi:methionine biosynthesis protein MetW [gamma proteobacterium HTCC5015]|nr:methionine biosynthesis protein MetW [gamma proteobacterium HTCC5015]
MSKLRADQQIIANWIQANSRVLDLGCGDGALLEQLTQHRQVSGYGVEIDPKAILQCTERGVNVIQQDLESGFGHLRNHSFDYVVMSQSLQTVQKTDEALLEMLRIGREGIISFPNMGYIRGRLQFALGGRMPVTRSLSHTWYQTPNIHLCTIRDFEALCREKGIEILERVVVDNDHATRPGMNWMPNLLGKVALYRLKKS